jgi:ring-1,2-phenylacetyl-CoA epoxidase subunit PaaD
MHAPEQARRPVTCPYCGTNETELLALFGQQLLTVQYYCRTCHTPFEYIKDDELCDERAVAHIFDPPPLG